MNTLHVGPDTLHTDIVATAAALVGADRATHADAVAARRRRLDTLIAHARAHSSYYRETLPDPRDADVALAALPILTKSTLMERFDDIVCDPRLHRAELEAHLAGPHRHRPFRGTHRVLRTSGSGGRPGLFVYDEAGWAGYVAQFLRVTSHTGTPLWEHPGLRVAVVAAVDPIHASAQVAMSVVGLGLAQLRPLPVTLPMTEIVAGLNDYQPDVLHAYASFAALLADEQRAGRLRIAPRILTTSSELLTPEMADRVRSAFGVPAFDFYATTEGLWAAECGEHAGMHLFEEQCIVENVNERGRPVPDGTPGARILITNLYNTAQPLIRYEIPDVIALDERPCPCGRTARRIRSVHGRRADVLNLGGITVHPVHFATITAEPAVREFQVVQRGERLILRIVPATGADTGPLAVALHDRVGAALRRLGVVRPQLEIQFCQGLDRSPGGKLRIVVADPTGAVAG